jgi:hypothetical protein
MKPIGLRGRATLAGVLFSAVGVTWLVAGPIRSLPVLRGDSDVGLQ